MILLICFSGVSMLIESKAQQINYGIRAGINNNHKNKLDLSVYEIYLNGAPPICSVLGNIIYPLNISFEMTLGLFTDKANKSFLVSVGPNLYLIEYDNIVFISTGIKPSFLTNHTFTEFDLGGDFNFISHIALIISLNEIFNLGYRFEHISNAGLYKNNPGVNLHFIELSFIL